MRGMRKLGAIGRVVAAGTLGVLAMMAALGSTGRVGLAEGDPEPTVVQYPDEKYVQGPGWPAGYTPPAPPAEISQKVREDWQDDLYWMNPAERADTLVLRALSPLPAWTQQYPYYWRYELLTCGKTTYAYYYPWPDTQLIAKYTDEMYTPAKVYPHGCVFSPVSSISKVIRLTPEEREQERLANKSFTDIALSRGGYPSEGGLSNYPYTVDGTPEKISVAFNGGDATPKFDAPAYLDPEVSRVRVPLRFVSELMGARVTWNASERSVTLHFPAVTRNVVHPVSNPGYQAIDWFPPNGYFPSNIEAYKLEDRPVTQPERSIVVTVGKGSALVDGQEMPLDAPPVIQPPGRVMVPIRFIAERLGAKVYWVGKDPIFPQTDGTLKGRYQVHIFTPFHPDFEYPSGFLEQLAVKF